MLIVPIYRKVLLIILKTVISEGNPHLTIVWLLFFFFSSIGSNKTWLNTKI